MNINVTAQEIDLKIYTPSGRWVTQSDLLTSTTHYVATSIDPGVEKTALTLSGRGRIKAIGFYIVSRLYEYDVYTGPRIRVYIDGETSPSIDVSPAEIDDFMGRLLLHQIEYDYETVSPASDIEIAFAQVVSPVCGLTKLHYDPIDNIYPSAGGYIVVNAEFLSSAEVKIYNGSDGVIQVRMLIVYGEYL